MKKTLKASSSSHLLLCNISKTLHCTFPAGACIVALGEKMAALYSPDDALRHGIEAAAKRTDEGTYKI